MAKRRPVIALTGASGYIGKHLSDKLTAHADLRVSVRFEGIITLFHLERGEYE